MTLKLLVRTGKLQGEGKTLLKRKELSVMKQICQGDLEGGNSFKFLPGLHSITHSPRKKRGALAWAAFAKQGIIPTQSLPGLPCQMWG